MVWLLFLLNGLRRGDNSEKEKKREKKIEIQRMTLLKLSLIGFIWTQICLKKDYLLENSSKVLNNEFISPSFELRTDANSSFCVLAKLNPSIIKSLINGFSGSFV